MEGADLRALRRTAGIKAREMATRLDISPSTLSRYENGRSPVPRIVELSARYLCEPNLAPPSAEQRLIAAIKEVANQ